MSGRREERLCLLFNQCRSYNILHDKGDVQLAASWFLSDGQNNTHAFQHYPVAVSNVQEMQSIQAIRELKQYASVQVFQRLMEIVRQCKILHLFCTLGFCSSFYKL